jgi:hypothetical protein
MSPTAAMNVVAVIRLTPGTVIRRLTASECSACSAMPRSEDRDLGVEEVDLAQAPIDGFAFVGGQERGARGADAHAQRSSADERRVRARCICTRVGDGAGNKRKPGLAPCATSSAATLFGE